jgi:hypothetical protein
MQLRFNIKKGTEFRAHESRQEIQVTFPNGRWITVNVEEDETENTAWQNFRPSMYEERKDTARYFQNKFRDGGSLFIDLEDVLYDSTGRCNLIKHNSQFDDWTEEKLLEFFHDPN